MDPQDDVSRPVHLEMSDPVGKNLAWDPLGGSLFIHSHLYDPAGVALGAGDEGLLDQGTKDVFRLFRELQKDAGAEADIDVLLRKNPKSLRSLAAYLSHPK